ncbi:MAG TPA: FAD-binding oxidoreductase [Abditibacteriaceae bacterium]|jgi:FAD/FMN-containing dehydrogenase
MTQFSTRTLAGWGNYPTQECHVYRPEKRRDLSALAATNDQRSFIARGLGRSYGDAALNDGAGVILQERLGRFLDFDPNSGVLSCEGGATFADILDTFLPRGFFLPVTPGTKYVTVGGAIAADVHGKNHHRDGTLAEFVLDFQLLLASGETILCSRDENPEAFWATIGGMGLTGIITKARLSLVPVTSAYISAHYKRAQNLDEALEQFDSDDQYQYSVAWIDCLASGDSLGRSVLIRGDHATHDEVFDDDCYHPLRVSHKKKKNVPLPFPDFALNPMSVKAFNAAYYASHPDGHALVDYDSFFYPLDAVQNWNRIYGKRGFVQYQVAFPTSTSRAGLVELLGKISASGRASFLAVLKSFGAQNNGLLSFPFAGHTLALDLPNSGDDLIPFMRELDEIVLRHDGRLYLAKDATMSPETFAAMYPRLNEFREIKNRLDPDERWASSLSKRLGITSKGNVGGEA